MYLDGFGKFLVIFVQKFFFTLLKKILLKKSLFLAISQKYDFKPKSDDLNRFLVKFPF